MALIVALAALAPATVRADSVATTGGATSITGTSAILNGTVDTSNPDSAWTFQYGTTTVYTAKTPTEAVGKGLTTVSATIGGLRPGTTYHFRLLVVEGSYRGQAHPGDDLTFTTTPAPRGTTRSFGTASILGRTLRVKHGVASVPMHCSGTSGARCDGKLSLTAGSGVRCGSGHFIAAAPHTHRVRIRLSSACAALLNRAPGHRLAAILRATFKSHQGKLTLSLTLRD